MRSLKKTISTKINFSKIFFEDFKYKKKYLIIISKNLDNFLLKIILHKLKDQITHIIKKPTGEPNSKNINFTSKKLHNLFFEEILVIGGGSTIDYAKALSIKNLHGNILNFEFSKDIIDAYPIRCVPTTCGSGSDVSPYAVINNSKTKRKFTISSAKLVPKSTHIYPLVLKYIDSNAIFASLYDAFSHCLEVYLNKKQNQKIKEIAFRGIGLGVKLLMKKISPKRYDDYMKLALIGGICISNSRTSIIHTMSVAVSKYYDLSHGLMNFFLTNLGIDFNKDFIKNDLKKIQDKYTKIPFREWVENLEKKNKHLLKKNFKKIMVDSVLKRIKQDKGLKNVCHQKICDKSLIKLIKDLHVKNKNFF